MLRRTRENGPQRASIACGQAVQHLSWDSLREALAAATSLAILKNCELLAEGQVLENEVRAGSEQGGESSQELVENVGTCLPGWQEASRGTERCSS